MIGRATQGPLLSISAALVAAGIVGCSNQPPVVQVEVSDTQTAQEFVQVSSPHAETGSTVLEGPTIGPDGALYLVDAAAPAGEPKVMRVDRDTGEVTTVFTNETSAYTSAQFGPNDGRLYLTDFVGGGVDSIAPDGSEFKTVFAGDVDGTRMMIDDMAFDEDGNMFVSDTTGLFDPSWQPQGRVVRIDGASREATVLADRLDSPNGISFDADYRGLWVSQYTANRIDYFGLDEARTAVTTAHPGVYFDGGSSQIDSNAVDADGNVYQAVHGQPSIYVYSRTGKHLATIGVPKDVGEGLDSATNIAIAPGTTEGYMTVSGADGGFVYTFDALAAGTRQSNGG